MVWWQREPAEHRQPIVNAPSGQHLQPYEHEQQDKSPEMVKAPSLTTIAKALLVSRSRLKLDPDKKLFFLYEPGKQVYSAVRIKNTSRSPVAFKFQTNAPKSCFMRPPCGILSPGETIIATVVKFVEQPEPDQEKKCKDKFKIVSLKVKQGAEFTQGLFDEQREFVAVERVLRVVYLDPSGNSPEVEKLNKRLAEAEAAQQARKKAPEERAQRTPPAEKEEVRDGKSVEEQDVVESIES